MATMYVTEYAEIARDDKDTVVNVGKEPALAIQAVSFTADSAAGTSAAFDGRTRFVRIVCDAAANIVFGTAPTAVTTDSPIAANVPEYFGVIPGQKVSAI